MIQPGMGTPRRPARMALPLGAAILGLWLLSSPPARAQGSEEGCFTDSANSARASAGVGPVAARADLAEVARRHSDDMASSGTIFHNQQLASEVQGKWQLLGENVGEGPSCDSVHDAFMRSPAHRANILEPRYNYVGMGVVTSNGTVFITEVFMQAKSDTAPAPAPVQPAPQPPPPAPSPKPPAAPKPPASPRAPSGPKPSVAAAPSPAAPGQPAPSVLGSAIAPSPEASKPGGPSPATTAALGATVVLLLAAGAVFYWYFVIRKRR